MNVKIIRESLFAERLQNVHPFHFGRERNQQFHQHEAEWPNVYFKIMSFAPQLFRRHVKMCTLKITFNITKCTNINRYLKKKNFKNGFSPTCLVCLSLLRSSVELKPISLEKGSFIVVTRPKSPILICPWVEKNILLGFKSRWIRPCRWTYSTAFTICSNMLTY